MIWRRRPSAPSEPEPEPEAHTSGYRMRSRRSVEDPPAQPAEVEPEVFPAVKRKRLIMKDEDGEVCRGQASSYVLHKYEMTWCRHTVNMAFYTGLR